MTDTLAPRLAPAEAEQAPPAATPETAATQLPQEEAFTIFSDPEPLSGEGTPAQPETAAPQPEKPLSADEQVYDALKTSEPLLYARYQQQKNAYYETLQQSGLTQDQIAKIEKRFRNKQPAEVAEYVNKMRLLLELKGTGLISDDEKKAMEKEFDQSPLEGPGSVLEAYGSFYPEFVLVVPDASIPTESAPVPFDTAEQAIKQPEAKTTTVEDLINTEIRKKAWEAFVGNDYPKGLPTDPAELLECQKKFEAFYNEKYLPKFKAGEYDEDVKTLKQQVSELGWDTLLTGARNSDHNAFWTNLLVHSTHSGGNDAIFSYNHEVDGDGTPVDVNKFKEMCSWSDDSGKSKDNKKKWMYLCALMYHELIKDPASNNPTETLEKWTEEPGSLDPNKIQAHMEELYLECMKKGKVDINKALRAALENEHNNYLLEKPSFTEKCHASSKLLTHFEMMARHNDYVQGFFN